MKQPPSNHAPEVESLLGFFKFDHLPKHLQPVSRELAGVAHKMASMLEGPELEAGLRKLLEAKDCFVRARLTMPDTSEREDQVGCCRPEADTCCPPQTQTEGQRIVAWNDERGLLDKPYDFAKQMSFIIEEVLEACDPDQDGWNQDTPINVIKGFLYRSNHTEIDRKAIPALTLNALCDIVVFCKGHMARLGYDPDKAMDETLKEIESRTGKHENGKWVKDPNAESYHPQYDTCKR